MAHIVSEPAKTRGASGAALEVGATITAACVSLLVVLIPAAVIVVAVTLAIDVPRDLQERIAPLLLAGLTIYALTFIAGVLLLAFGRSHRHSEY